MPLSRTETKELIFETLAAYFEKNGVTTCVTVAEIIAVTNDRPNRIQSLFDEMVLENVIYKGCEEPDGYRLTGSAYMHLCMALEEGGRLPEGIEIEYGGFGDDDREQN